MTTSEIIKALRDMLPEPVDYAELVGSPVPSSCGIHYVWEDPEPYILNEAANKLEEYASIGYTPLEIKYMLQCGARAAGFPLDSCIPEDGVTEEDLES